MVLSLVLKPLLLKVLTLSHSGTLIPVNFLLGILNQGREKAVCWESGSWARKEVHEREEHSDRGYREA